MKDILYPICSSDRSSYAYFFCCYSSTYHTVAHDRHVINVNCIISHTHTNMGVIASKHDLMIILPFMIIPSPPTSRAICTG